MSSDSVSNLSAKAAHSALGPVADLEAHVSPDWWRTIFDGLYLQTDGDVVEDPAITAREVDAFAEVLSLAPDMHILDLCCGQARHGLELSRRGFRNVYGLDYSSFLIDLARQRAEDAGLDIDLRVGDARELPYTSHRFDAVLMLGNSFGYFADGDDDLRVLQEARRVLKPTGQLLLDLSDGEYLRSHFDKRSWEWVDSELLVCRERSLSSDGSRLISRELITHLKDGIIDDRFYAERLYAKDDITGLLRSVGFDEITFERALRPDSQRNQDLGMMARRHVIRAADRGEGTRRAGRQGAPSVARSKSRDIVVVLGDPHLPETIEEWEEVREQDRVAVEQLKEGLGSIDGARFHYLNDHETLLDDLIARVGTFDYVLNLCDDGLRNDARNELHVPALLEVLGISYSGANPQCLAYCYDKSIVRGAAREMGIPVADAVLGFGDADRLDLPFSFPAIVKANDGDGSLGLTRHNIVRDSSALEEAVARIRGLYGPDAPVLIEEFLPGKDLTVGIIGNRSGGYTVLPIVEEDYSSLPSDLPHLCGYEAKWELDSPYTSLRSIRADLPDDVAGQLERDSLRLFERLQCRDYARIDWRLDEKGRPRLLEVNPNPGWCWDGHLAKQAAIIDLSYAGMLEKLLDAVDARLGLGVAAGERRVGIDT